MLSGVIINFLELEDPSIGNTVLLGATLFIKPFESTDSPPFKMFCNR